MKRRQMIKFALKEYLSFALFLLRGLDTKRVCRLYGFIQTRLIRPNVAYCAAGTVNSAVKLYLVIESVQPDTNTLGFPQFPPTAREFCPSPESGVLPARTVQVSPALNSAASPRLHAPIVKPGTSSTPAPWPSFTTKKQRPAASNRLSYQGTEMPEHFKCIRLRPTGYSILSGSNCRIIR